MVKWSSVIQTCCARLCNRASVSLKRMRRATWSPWCFKVFWAQKAGLHIYPVFSLTPNFQSCFFGETWQSDDSQALASDARVVKPRFTLKTHRAEFQGVSESSVSTAWKTRSCPQNSSWCVLRCTSSTPRKTQKKKRSQSSNRNRLPSTKVWTWNIWSCGQESSVSCVPFFQNSAFFFINLSFFGFILASAWEIPKSVPKQKFERLTSQICHKFWSIKNQYLVQISAKRLDLTFFYWIQDNLPKINFCPGSKKEKRQNKKYVGGIKKVEESSRRDFDTLFRGFFGSKSSVWKVMRGEHLRWHQAMKQYPEWKMFHTEQLVLERLFWCITQWRMLRVR